MVDRSGPYRRDLNSTSYIHSNEENLMNLHKSMEYDSDGKPRIRVTSNIEGDITITGSVTIPGTIEISNDEGSPIPTHTHLFDENEDEYTASNPFTIDGTVNIGTMPEVEIKNDTGNPVPVSGTVTVNQPVAVTDNGGSLTVDGNVGVTGDVNVTQGTSPWVVSGNVNATITGSPAVGSNKPFYLEVAQGLIPGYTFNHKFGAAPSMAQTTASVWDVDDTIYPWDALAGGSVVNIERNSTSDTGKTVTVQGLDTSGNFLQEEITITGADQTGSAVFERVNRAFVSSGATNVANIDIEAGAAGGTTVGRITAGLGQTLMALYTIPAGKTGYLLHGTASGSSDTDATGFMMVRFGAGDYGTSAFRVGHSFELQLRGGQYDYTFQTPIPIPEFSDIEVRIVNRSNNKRITAAFDILLVDN